MGKNVYAELIIISWRPRLKHMTTSKAPTSIDQQRELNEILWDYRSRLRRVEVLLEAQLMFMGSGRDNALGVIADMLDETALQVGELDLRREMFFHQDAAPASGEPLTLSLTELSVEADNEEQAAWAEILRDHQRFLDTRVRRIQHLVAQSRQSQETMLDLLAQATSQGASGGNEPALQRYDRTGQTVRTPLPAMVFDGKA